VIVTESKGSCDMIIASGRIIKPTYIREV